MRELIKYSLFVLDVFVLACKKKKEAPTETTTNSNVVTNLTPQEQNMVGNWIMDSVAQYNSSIWQSSYSAAGINMLLQNVKPSTGCLSQDSSCHYGLGWTSGGSVGAWSAKQSNLLRISVPSNTPCTSSNTIVSVNPTSLVLRSAGASSTQTTVQYFHK